MRGNGLPRGFYSSYTQLSCEKVLNELSNIRITSEGIMAIRNIQYLVTRVNMIIWLISILSYAFTPSPGYGHYLY